ncbi:flagellar hook-length control protein FliK [Cellvibrio japonicus]|uniref:Putative flagellar hook-length control protein FliK n=1 Tax=Cellvibrio japonicus (strain Ueda107) TaxID=498211 RepID=B3PEZ5_CELJU|nr:flagellar hook-length control protein FliK [Cellvibrio japonicus]ACE86315.1 putative flagellar hook-length control protein FliK [Cellvibrio japonicus Ueda107]QEI12241.1 hypothetical protein FY117_08380 [Cellvibrio japonicus]QEI15815.1 hypothetical protein FY116_08385 [Cellvibrio japonicus]QEI19393.1 hypothetical protein FY115_08380 [Cellvibrio japonicus]
MQHSAQQSGLAVNSLLNLSANVPARTTKSQSNPANTDATSFQQLMQNTRPEVATRPAVKPAASPVRPQEERQADTRPAPANHSHESPRKNPSNPQAPSAKCSEPAMSEQSGANHKKLATDSAVETNTETGIATDKADETLIPEQELMTLMMGELPVEPSVLVTEQGDETPEPLVAPEALLLTAGQIASPLTGEQLSADLLVEEGESALKSPLLTFAGRGQVLVPEGLKPIDPASLATDPVIEGESDQGITLDLDNLQSQVSKVMPELAKSLVSDKSQAGDKPILDALKTPAPPAPVPVDALGRPLDANSPLSPTARSFVAQMNLPQAMGNPQWSQAVSDRVLWMAAQNLSAADIRLDPPDLGSMHVKVSVSQDQASVTFVSPHPQVREALDQQATRLREMFAEQGLNLVNVDVSDRHQQQRAQDESTSGNRSSESQAEEEALQVVGESSIGQLRLIDHYA